MYMFGLLVVFVLPSLFSPPVVYAHGDEVHSDLPSKVNVCHSLSDTEKGDCYTLLCGDTSVSACAEDIVDASFSGSGPKFAFAVLHDLSTVSFFSPLDGYSLSQRIGVALAEEQGASGDVFMRCPSDFRYGCSHGFFLSISGDSAGSASSVCGSLSSPAMCHHRVGHVFMKHTGYVFSDALRLCDTLSDSFRSSCWDGVFMEGVHEALSGGTVSGFVSDDPLAPCSRVSDQYRGACYGTHGPYLLRYFDGSVADASGACAGAGIHHSVCESFLASEGHTHVRHSSDDRSWFRRFLDFLLSFFGFATDISDSAAYGSSGRYEDHAVTSVSLSEPAAVVVYRDGAYIPQTVRISVGERVMWVNEDSVFWPASDRHPTHRLYPGSDILKCSTDSRDTLFDACEAMGPGAEYSFVFGVSGEWDFHDHINPRARGTVIVIE